MVGVPKKANDQIFYKNVNMNPNINTFKNIHANSKSVSFPNKKIINNFLAETNSINGNNLYSKNINDDIDEQLYTLQNLVNLNKDKTTEEECYLYNSNNDINNDKNLKTIKKTEISEQGENFFLKATKKNFNEEKILKDNPDNRKHIDLTKSKLMSDIDYNQKYPHNTIKYGEKKDKKIFEI